MERNRQILFCCLIALLSASLQSASLNLEQGGFIGWSREEVPDHLGILQNEGHLQKEPFLSASVEMLLEPSHHMLNLSARLNFQDGLPPSSSFQSHLEESVARQWILQIDDRSCFSFPWVHLFSKVYYASTLSDLEFLENKTDTYSSTDRLGIKTLWDGMTARSDMALGMGVSWNQVQTEDPLLTHQALGLSLFTWQELSSTQHFFLEAAYEKPFFVYQEQLSSFDTKPRSSSFDLALRGFFTQESAPFTLACGIIFTRRSRPEYAGSMKEEKSFLASLSYRWGSGFGKKFLEQKLFF